MDRKQIGVYACLLYTSYRNADGDKLMGTKGTTGSAEEVAVIAGSKVTYNKTDVAKALLRCV